MKKINMVKAAVSFFTGMGSVYIVNGVVNNNVVTDTKFQKVCVFAGRIAIGSLVSTAVDIHVDKTIDELSDWWKNWAWTSKTAEDKED